MRFVRVDMTTGQVSDEQLDGRFTGMGGRVLTSALVSERVPPCSDPLGKENRLVFAPGLLTGTPLINTGRLSVGSKSPLTGGIKESNVGGTMALALARQGIRAVEVEGAARPGTLLVLVVDEQGARLEDAAEFAGMRTYALAEALSARFGDEYSIACIGPAGEMCLKSASIQVTDPDGCPSRAAGRGGLGAVMGAKGLKAVAVSRRGRAKKEPADPAAFREAMRRFAAAVRADDWSGKVLPEFGTASILAGMDMSGALPTRNAREGRFDSASEIDGDALAGMIRSRGGRTSHRGCSQCAISCSNVYVDESGAQVTSGLEYETLWAMGAMIANGDLDSVARLDFLCDDLGLDTMNTGAALAVAMDAGLLPFGDGRGAAGVLEGLVEGDALGVLVGHGPDAVGAHFGCSRVPSVKGQSIAGYDPRAMPALGITYATSPMGADHTAGFAEAADASPAELRKDSFSAQIHTAAYDGTGLCMFAESGGLDNVLAMLTALSGEPNSMEDWLKTGRDCLRREADFNRRAGLRPEDDRLPSFFYEEGLQGHGTVPFGSDELQGALRNLLDSE